MAKPVKRNDACFCKSCEAGFFWTESVYVRTAESGFWVCGECWKTFDFQPFVSYNKWLAVNSEEKIRSVLDKIYTRRPWVRMAAYRHASWFLDQKKPSFSKHFSGVDIENYKQKAVYGGTVSSRTVQGVKVRPPLRRRNRYVARREQRIRDARRRTAQSSASDTSQN